MQQALSSGRKDRFIYYVFDLLYCNGVDLRNVPLIDRKTLLQRILEPIAGSGNVRLPAQFHKAGGVLHPMLAS